MIGFIDDRGQTLGDEDGLGNTLLDEDPVEEFQKEAIAALFR